MSAATASPAAAAPASRRVAVNSLLQGGADAVGKLGQVLLFAVMVRAVGVAAFGDFNSAASLSVMVMVAALGMDFRVTRLVALGEPGAGEAFWSALVLKLAFGAAILGVVGVVAAVGPYSHRVLIATLVLGLAMLSDLALLTPQAVFRGHERLGPVAAGLVVYRITLTVAGIALLSNGASIVSVAAAWLASSLLGNLYTARQMRRAGLHYPFSVTRASLRAVGADSIGLGLAAVFGAVLARLDIILLGLLKDSTAVAYYGGAYRLVESLQFVTVAVALASFPTMARLNRTSTPTISDAATLAIKIMTILTAPIAIAFVLYASPIVRALYGHGLVKAAPILQLLAPMLFLSAVNGLFAYILTAQKHQRTLVIALGASAVTNLVANLLLIPPYGARGAAIAMTATMVVMGVLYFSAGIRVTGALNPQRILVGSGAASIAMAAVGLALGRNLVSFLLASLAFAAVLALVERQLFPVDAGRMSRALRRQPVT